ncbi:hypothetical protein [Gilliamella apicola]|uniref:hypothetical protein n=1 Tax=Gilliamella apicola TaxID=1196095 RepID=UPI002FEE4085
MSYFAIDLDTKEMHDVKWFQIKRKKIALCPICDNKIELRAENSLMTSAHFWHGKNSICTSIKKNRKKYEDLPFSQLDKEAGKKLRKEIKNNLYTIFLACNALCEGLKYLEFKELIIKANEKAIWDYKGLKLNYIPYILILFHDIFYAKGSKLRDEKFYFVLEPSIKNFDDLWNIKKNIKQYIWKISPDKGVLEIIKIKQNLDPVPEWFKRATEKLLI